MSRARAWILDNPFDYLLTILPDEPVAAGARWRVEDRRQWGDITGDRERTYTLTSLESDLTVVEGTLDVATEDQPTGLRRSGQRSIRTWFR